MRRWDVPRADLALQYCAIKPEIDAAITGILERAELIGGPTLAAFEEAFAARCGVKSAVGTSSGTAALQLALLEAGVTPGGEVIVPAFTFAATAAAVIHCGATPVFVDVRVDDFCLDAEAARSRLTERTQAVIPVHLFGRVAAMASLRELGVPIVEDAAQAFGATREGKVSGALGTFGCFSFHPSKNLGLFGDGGMITTGDREAAASLRARINHGRSPNGEHLVVGFNHRLDALQAAVGLVKLRHVDAWTARRRALAQAYAAGLESLDLVLPEITEGHVFHQYAVLSDRRDALAAHLEAAGIATATFYARPVYREPAFAAHAPDEPCGVAERLSGRVLCLPIHAELSDEQQRKVITSIHRFFGSHVRGR